MTDRLPVPRPSGEPAARRYLAERTRDLLREEPPRTEPGVPAPGSRFLVSADLGHLDRGQVLSMVREFLPRAVAAGEHACEDEGFRYEVHPNPSTDVVPYAWNILLIPLTPQDAPAGFRRAVALYEWFEERGFAASPAMDREAP
ncbi:hypothetical protein A6A08_18110 [Nocardiopsis sp. TSRI0078]|uniref:hypothetical protein n=1 Tax=unclassified Nocardiopsis TaxID=2649073 RepID=UPI00093BBBF3|nr:hypothetical protein [Nocardiopsis sp. TSRI0078]OKI22872.1 hypothetical protein A6A08_18110 [Nocardiopsis sp. TSRI0078]